MCDVHIFLNKIHWCVTIYIVCGIEVFEPKWWNPCAMYWRVSC